MLERDKKIYIYIYIFIASPHALCLCDETFFILFFVSKFYLIGNDYSFLGEKKERDI